MLQELIIDTSSNETSRPIACNELNLSLPEEQHQDMIAFGTRVKKLLVLDPRSEDTVIRCLEDVTAPFTLQIFNFNDTICFEYVQIGGNRDGWSRRFVVNPQQPAVMDIAKLVLHPSYLENVQALHLVSAVFEIFSELGCVQFPRCTELQVNLIHTDKFTDTAFRRGCIFSLPNLTIFAVSYSQPLTPPSQDDLSAFLDSINPGVDYKQLEIRLYHFIYVKV